MGRELSKGVKKFIAEHVRSVLQLEVLLLLREKREREWSAEAVDRELHLSVKSAKVVLDGLVSDGLLIPGHGPAAELYRYNPSSDHLDEVVGQLASAYATQRVAVLTLIFANPVDKVRLFTETFRMIRNTDKT